MISYTGLSFIVPTFVAILAFIAWMVLLSRMTNLKLKLRWRIATFVYAFSMLMLPIQDLNREHNYESCSGVVISVTMKTVYRSGNFLAAIWIYHLLAMSYPMRIAVCPKEPVSALGGDEKFMAEDTGSHLHNVISASNTEDAKLAREKTKSREQALVAKTVAVAVESVRQAESSVHEAATVMSEADRLARETSKGAP